MLLDRLPYREVWCVDTEFYQDADLRPVPVCLVGRELRSGRLIRCWADQLAAPPFDTGPEVLFVAYLAAAEMQTFLRLGWPLPPHVLDLFAEFRNLTNGLAKDDPGMELGRGLLGACYHFGIPAMAQSGKDEMHTLILTGGPWSTAQRRAILDYCQEDVDVLGPLLERMLPKITATPKGFKQALHRGRYTGATVARMQDAGTPLEVTLLDRLQAHWPELKLGLVRESGLANMFDGTTLKLDRLEDYAAAKMIPWPRTERSGRLAIDEDTLRDLGKAYPAVKPIGELLYLLGKLKLNELAANTGVDGRNRVLLSPLGAKTGRNTPSNTRSVFGPAVWARGLITPPPGRALAYVDWKSQEIALAGWLYQDPVLLADVASGDPYIAFGRRTGLVPPDATRETHEAEREQFKVLLLGTNYGMWIHGLAQRAAIGEHEALYLLRLLARTYETYADRADAETMTARMRGWQRARSGWHRWVKDTDTDNSIRNWPIQTLGSELLRLACCLVTEAGVQVDMPVHDALLVEADVGQLGSAVATTQAAMAAASRLVLDGYEIPTDVKVVVAPERYSDRRGEVMWSRVMRLLERIE
jgi:DNA polymerase family A